jgi:hypothetical protein
MPRRHPGQCPGRSPIPAGVAGNCRRWAQRHPDWLLGFEDEVWWSRLARPALHAWQDDDHPLHLMEHTVARDDPDPKALACYGLLARCWDATARRSEELWLPWC